MVDLHFPTKYEYDGLYECKAVSELNGELPIGRATVKVFDSTLELSRYNLRNEKF